MTVKYNQDKIIMKYRFIRTKWFKYIMLSIVVMAGISSSADTKELQIKNLNMSLVFIEPASFAFAQLSNVKRIKYMLSFSKPYWIGKYEITQKQYRKIMGKNPSKHKGDNLPVEMVKYGDAVEFCKRLTDQEHKNGALPKECIYRLPTAAEWEFAAKGGKLDPGFLYSGSNNIDEVAWYGKNSDNKTHPVGEKEPNELGLYDMTGNVFEWCSDWFGRLPRKNEVDWENKAHSSYGLKVNRGGCYLNHIRFCTTIYRNCTYYNDGYETIGFRIVRTTNTQVHPPAKF